jgi:hypothetical protein
MSVTRLSVRSAIVAVAVLCSMNLLAAGPAAAPGRPAAALDPAGAHERRLDAMLLHLPLPAAVLDGAEHTLTVELRDRDHVVVRPESHRIDAQKAAGTAIRLTLQGMTRAALLMTPDEMHARLRFIVTVDGQTVAEYSVREMLANDETARAMKNVETERGRKNVPTERGKIRSPGDYDTAANRIVNHYYYPFSCPGSACYDQYTECVSGCPAEPETLYIDYYDECRGYCQSTLQSCSAGQRIARRVVETELPDVRVVANECICDPVSYILTLGLNCFKYDSYFRTDHFEVYEDRYCPGTGQHYYNVLVEEWDETQFCYHAQKNSDGSWSGCQFGEVLWDKCNISAPR